VKTVLIIGGGRIGYYLAHQLINIGMDIKIIEQNYDRCLELCEDLPKATIICGDGTDHDLLKEEGLAHFDAFVAVTGNDEGNMIMSLYASTNNVPTVVTKVNRATYADAIDKLGLSSVVSPKLVTASRIVSYVRAMHNSLSSGVETLYQLVGGRVEALEFSIKEKARYIGIPLKDLSFKKDALIACIVRGRETIIPGGNDSIQVGDSVVVVTAAEHRLYDLEDILQ
jgi:trk system potassium uptake protein TrkA